jgi:hypothetical protein
MLSLRRLWPATLTTSLLAACGTVAMPPTPDEPPLFRRIEAQVGIVYTAPARTATLTNPLIRIEIGKAMADRFGQAFASMFTQALEMPDWPPWRETTVSVDGVMEVELTQAELVLGDDLRRPDVLDLAFRVCLYDPTGAPLRCWAPTARHSHQRVMLECLDLRTCLQPMAEGAMREVMARFLVAAENDPTLLTWAAGLAQKRAVP